MSAPASAIDVRQAVRSLGLALRKRRMYPPGSPTVSAAVQTAYAELCRAQGGEPLSLDVLPDALLTRGPDDATLRHDEDELSRRLHLARVGRIALRPELEAGGLKTLLDVLIEEEDDARVGRRLAAGEVPGVSVELLDLEQLFASGGVVAGVGEEIWARLLDAFHHASGQPADGRRTIADPDLLGALFSWIVETDSLPAALRGYSRVDLLSVGMEQAASGTDADPETIAANLGRAVATVFEKADPETWMEVLAEPLPVEAGGGGARRTIDLTVVAARALSALQIEELVRYGVGTRPHATPRLYRLFAGLLGPRPDREAIAERLGQTLSPELAEAWPGLLDVLNGEDSTPYFDNDYRATLDRPAPEESDLWDLAAIRRRRHELHPTAIRVHKGRIALSILAGERVPEDYLVVLAELESALLSLVEEARLDLLDEIIATLDRHRADPDRPEEIRRAAAAALERMQAPEFVDAVLALLGDGGHERFHVLWRILDRLGSDCVPRILDLMEENPGDSTLRRYLGRILGDVATLPLQLLSTRIRDGSPALARQLVLVLASTGRSACLTAVHEALRHDDPGVRRAAVTAMGHLHVAGHELPLLEALSDPALEVRVAALRTLRGCMRDGCEERLRRYLEISNRTGRNTGIIVAAIRAVETLEETGLTPILRKLGRKPWLFPARRRAVWKAARRATVRIESARGVRTRADLDTGPARRAA